VCPLVHRVPREHLRPGRAVRPPVQRSRAPGRNSPATAGIARLTGASACSSSAARGARSALPRAAPRSRKQRLQAKRRQPKSPAAYPLHRPCSRDRDDSANHTNVVLGGAAGCHRRAIRGTRLRLSLLRQASQERSVDTPRGLEQAPSPRGMAAEPGNGAAKYCLHHRRHAHPHRADRRDFSTVQKPGTRTQLALRGDEVHRDRLPLRTPVRGRRSRPEPRTTQAVALPLLP
jgi:hypothetical protein